MRNHCGSIKNYAAGDQRTACSMQVNMTFTASPNSGFSCWISHGKAMDYQSLTAEEAV